MKSSPRRDFAEIGPQPHLHRTFVSPGPQAPHHTGQLLHRYGLDCKCNGVKTYTMNTKEENNE